MAVARIGAVRIGNTRIGEYVIDSVTYTLDIDSVAYESSITDLGLFFGPIGIDFSDVVGSFAENSVGASYAQNAFTAKFDLSGVGASFK